MMGNNRRRIGMVVGLVVIGASALAAGAAAAVAGYKARYTGGTIAAIPLKCSGYFNLEDEQAVRFVFGIDAQANLIDQADSLPRRAWERLKRPAKYEIQTEVRRRPENIKDIKVIEREFQNIRLRSEDVASFAYSPTACQKTYRIVVVRKNLSIEKGARCLFDDIRYFFYITNDRESKAAEIVFEANARCNQENLIAQLHGTHATRMPVDTLLSNWAYMVMASLAWTLKAWFALLLPERGRWREKCKQEKLQVLRMEFRTFLNAFMRVPAQVVRTGRRIVFRLLSWNPGSTCSCVAWSSSRDHCEADSEVLKPG